VAARIDTSTRATYFPGMKSARIALTLLFTLFSNCESSGGNKNDTFAAICKAKCDSLVRCDSDSMTAEEQAACLPDCMATSLPNNLFKPGVLSAVTACYEGLQCNGGSTEQCSLGAVVTQNPKWMQDPTVLACNAKYSTCKSSFSDTFYDYCGLLAVLVSDKVAALEVCTDLDCSAIEGCATNALGGL
jgi:hypothetical protein